MSGDHPERFDSLTRAVVLRIAAGLPPDVRRRLADACRREAGDLEHLAERIEAAAPAPVSDLATAEAGDPEATP